MLSSSFSSHLLIFHTHIHDGYMHVHALDSMVLDYGSLPEREEEELGGKGAWTHEDEDEEGGDMEREDGRVTGLEAALGRSVAEIERLQRKVHEQDVRATRVRAVLMEGLEELGVAASGGSDSDRRREGREKKDGEEEEALIANAELQGLRIEDVAKLVVDIAVSLNSDDAPQSARKKHGHGVAPEDDGRGAQGARRRVSDEMNALQLECADDDMTRRGSARTLAVSASTASGRAGTSMDDSQFAELDELYRREAALSIQLAELKQRLGSAQHEAIVEIKRRQKLERDWETEWAARQRLEKKLLSVRKRYEAARSQFVDETTLREAQLEHLKKVQGARRLVSYTHMHTFRVLISVMTLSAWKFEMGACMLLVCRVRPGEMGLTLACPLFTRSSFCVWFFFPCAWNIIISKLSGCVHGSNEPQHILERNGRHLQRRPCATWRKAALRRRRLSRKALHQRRSIIINGSITKTIMESTRTTRRIVPSNRNQVSSFPL